MITLEIKTSLSKDDEQKFLNELIKAIDTAEYHTRFKIENQEKFIRVVGTKTE